MKKRAGATIGSTLIRNGEPARSMLGMMNLRQQIKRYRNLPEEEDKPVGKMRPRKIDDGVVDILRAFATHRWPRKPLMNDAERRTLYVQPLFVMLLSCSLTLNFKLAL